MKKEERKSVCLFEYMEKLHREGGEREERRDGLWCRRSRDLPTGIGTLSEVSGRRGTDGEGERGVSYLCVLRLSSLFSWAYLLQKTEINKIK